jgi:hypothetical protein
LEIGDISFFDHGSDVLLTLWQETGLLDVITMGAACDQGNLKFSGRYASCAL